LTIDEKTKMPQLDDGWGKIVKMDVAGVDVKSHKQQLNQRWFGLVRSIN
jgi:hypothetical protein